MTFEELNSKYLGIVSTEYSLKELSENFINELNILQLDLTNLRVEIANSIYSSDMLLDLGRTISLLEIVTGAITRINQISSEDSDRHVRILSIQHELAILDREQGYLENLASDYLYQQYLESNQQASIPGILYTNEYES